MDGKRLESTGYDNDEHYDDQNNHQHEVGSQKNQYQDPEYFE